MAIKEWCTSFVAAIYLHLYKSLRLRNDLLVGPSTLFMSLNSEISLNVYSPLSLLKIVESRGWKEGGGGGVKQQREEGKKNIFLLFLSPLPPPPW